MDGGADTIEGVFNNNTGCYLFASVLSNDTVLVLRSYLLTMRQLQLGITFRLPINLSQNWNDAVTN